MVIYLAVMCGHILGCANGYILGAVHGYIPGSVNGHIFGSVIIRSSKWKQANGYILGCVLLETSKWKRVVGSYVFGYVLNEMVLLLVIYCTIVHMFGCMKLKNRCI